jgi:hypothetical protein
VGDYKVTPDEHYNLEAAAGLTGFGIILLFILLISMIKAGSGALYNSGFLLGLLHVLSIIVCVLVGLLALWQWDNVSKLTKKPKEPTHEEKMADLEKQAAMLRHLSTLEKVKKEHIQDTINRVQLEQQLSKLTGQKAGDDVPPWLLEFADDLEKVKNISQIEQMTADKIKEYPDQRDLLETLLDKYRERLLRKE